MATRKLDTFAKRFIPVAPPTMSNAGFWTESEIKAAGIHPADFVWTEVDPGMDNGMTYLLPGYHFVNRTHNFMVTEEPWTEADLADEYRVDYNPNYFFEQVSA